ncbi:Luciferase-like monooxygenase [Chitinasiproducens palmae]|uniref:Luciferase-like monooxygenase n=1 Tax=Chitinasiproducens palmae TaxID=1770053 RepID=A0A1H2PR30_9BURK|nr:Luciferase-like monooxygenase [Chitinasiproducens palmae]
MHFVVPASARASFADLQASVHAAERSGWAAVLVETGPGALEPITALAALASTTARIGLVAEIDPLVTPPYTAARRLAALDHISGGRAGWRVRVHDNRAQRAEYAQVLRALWDSWLPDAHRFDKREGLYVDTARVRRVDFAGEHFAVAGPLDIPRPPQRHPVLYGAGDDAVSDDAVSDGGVSVDADLRSGEAAGALQAADGWAACKALRPRGTRTDARPLHYLLVPTDQPERWPAQLAALNRQSTEALGTAASTLRDRWQIPLPLTGETHDVE